jgi:hypothetical protein
MRSVRSSGEAAAIFPLHRRVPVILYSIVAYRSAKDSRLERTAPRKFLGNFGPFGSDLCIEASDGFLFFKAERGFVEDGVDVVMPSLSALLPCATSQTRSDDDPLLCSKLVH